MRRGYLPGRLRLRPRAAERAAGVPAPPSYTQMEFDIANALSKPVFLFRGRSVGP